VEAHDDTFVTRVRASVTLRTDERRRAMLERVSGSADDPAQPARLRRSLLDPGTSAMSVSLAADSSDGRRIATGRRDFGFGGPRRGLAAIRSRYRGPLLSDDPAEHARLLDERYAVGLVDIEDAIDEHLGRVPSGRPPVSRGGICRTRFPRRASVPPRRT
jgi:hypothetical protein